VAGALRGRSERSIENREEGCYSARQAWRRFRFHNR
jgi:hypothetical protein